MNGFVSSPFKKVCNSESREQLDTRHINIAVNARTTTRWLRFHYNSNCAEPKWNNWKLPVETTKLMLKKKKEKKMNMAKMLLRSYEGFILNVLTWRNIAKVSVKLTKATVNFRKSHRMIFYDSYIPLSGNLRKLQQTSACRNCNLCVMWTSV